MCRRLVHVHIQGDNALKDLQTLTEEIIVWQRKQFPNANTRSTILHLASEIGEAIAATEPRGLRNQVKQDALVKLEYGSLKTPAPVSTEIADIFILLVQMSDTLGINLAEAVEQKMMVNVDRNWRIPDKHGVVEHK